MKIEWFHYNQCIFRQQIDVKRKGSTVRTFFTVVNHLKKNCKKLITLIQDVLNSVGEHHVSVKESTFRFTKTANNLVI